MRYRLVLGAAIWLGCVGPALAAPTPEQTAQAALTEAPVWDGHNDVPEQLRDRRKDVLDGFDFRDTTHTAAPKLVMPWGKGVGAMQTDLTRLHKGHVGAQFWSVYVSAALPEPQAVQATLEQIDVLKRLVARYPAEMRYCDTSACVTEAWKTHQIASLIGIEGGHSIGGSLGVLRQMYALGARYMTLAHFRNNAWADSATDVPAHGGLTPFGKDVVREMQRIGMLVDLSHVSEGTMMAALDVAKAPVMFSHSSARGIDAHPRNVPDGVLDRLKANGGLVMANDVPDYISEAVRAYAVADKAEAARDDANHIGDPAAAAADHAAWTAAHPAPHATVAQLADHIDYMVKRIGIDHVGVGGDFDGGADNVDGFADVSAYPALFTELARRGYAKADLEKIASGNMLRVLRGAETYAAAHRGDPPIETPTVF